MIIWHYLKYGTVAWLIVSSSMYLFLGLYEVSDGGHVGLQVRRDAPLDQTDGQDALGLQLHRVRQARRWHRNDEDNALKMSRIGRCVVCKDQLHHGGTYRRLEPRGSPTFAVGVAVG